MGDLAERAREQHYFDEAWRHRERERERLGRPPASAGANPKAEVALRLHKNRQLRSFRPADEAVAFGRIDTDDDERYYVGYQVIYDDSADVVVVNWQAPIARAFFEATEDDPLGLTRRRRFHCDGNTIVDFEDALVAELAGRVAEAVAAAPAEPVEPVEPAGAAPDVDDALLAELERARTVEMGDIVRTIRAAQHRVFRAGLDQLLVVQGGPGTGKTVVALHRVSWLLYNHRDTLRPQDVLVVGPNPTFVRYIRNVLPGLGDREVEQLPLAALGPEVRLGRAEAPEVVALKGSARMAGLLDRALAQRVGLPPGRGPLELPVGNRVVRFDRRAVQAQLDRLASSPYAVGRQALREFLVRGARQEGSAEARADVADPLLDRIWPQFTAPAFLRDLLNSEPRLLRAAGDHFTAREVVALRRKAADRLSAQRWSLADVALLDHVQARMTGQAPRRFRHVVVDEAQDLSPMQLASIGRRSEAHSMTVLGDIAQSTGPWARDSWDDVVTALGGGRHVERAELAVGYRVPRQAYEVAARLLPSAAPGVRPPRVVREGPEPAFLRVDDGAARAARVVEQAMAFAGRGLMVGVIRPEAVAGEVAAALAARDVRWSDASSDGLAAGINVLTPDEAKGLEFDAVVVVEPDLIAAGGRAGLRSLYVALTRTTRHLTVVHVGRPLPTLTDPAAPLTTPTPTPTPAPVPSTTSVPAPVGSSPVPAGPRAEPQPAVDHPGYFTLVGGPPEPPPAGVPTPAGEREAAAEAPSGADDADDAGADGHVTVPGRRGVVGDTARSRGRLRPSASARRRDPLRHVLAPEPPPVRPPLGPPPRPAPAEPSPALDAGEPRGRLAPAGAGAASPNGAHPGAGVALARRLARSFADEVRAGLVPELWGEVAAALADELGAGASAALDGGERDQVEQGVVEVGDDVVAVEVAGDQPVDDDLLGQRHPAAHGQP